MTQEKCISCKIEFHLQNRKRPNPTFNLNLASAVHLENPSFGSYSVLQDKGQSKKIMDAMLGYKARGNFKLDGSIRVKLSLGIASEILFAFFHTPFFYSLDFSSFPFLFFHNFVDTFLLGERFLHGLFAKILFGLSKMKPAFFRLGMIVVSHLYIKSHTHAEFLDYTKLKYHSNFFEYFFFQIVETVW